jgi:AcrR family transcriptional regulator
MNESGPNKALRESLLTAQLTNPADQKLTPLDALKLARKQFAAGQRLDMGQLSEELGVSRPTLYRWVGTREQLLTEVLWSFTEQFLLNAKESASHTERGGTRVATEFSQLIRDTVNSKSRQIFLEREPEFAMRLLTSSAGLYQSRLIAYCQKVIEAELAESSWTITVEPAELAYGVIRMGESYVYRPLITGEKPDTGNAEAMLRLLLR